MLRFILYLLFFYIVSRVILIIIRNSSGTKNNVKIKSNPVQRKSKFEDVEEAKYVEIKSGEEEKK